MANCLEQSLYWLQWKADSLIKEIQSKLCATDGIRDIEFVENFERLIKQDYCCDHTLSLSQQQFATASRE